jgi:hypothetical protein
VKSGLSFVPSVTITQSAIISCIHRSTILDLTRFKSRLCFISVASSFELQFPIYQYKNYSLFLLKQLSIFQLKTTHSFPNHKQPSIMVSLKARSSAKLKPLKKLFNLRLPKSLSTPTISRRQQNPQALFEPFDNHRNGLDLSRPTSNSTPAQRLERPGEQLETIPDTCQCNWCPVLEDGSANYQSCGCDPVAKSRTRIADLQDQLAAALKEDSGEESITHLAAQVCKEMLTPSVHQLLALGVCYNRQDRIAYSDILTHLHEHEVFATGLIAPMVVPEGQLPNPREIYSTELREWARQELDNRWKICDEQLALYKEDEHSRTTALIRSLVVHLDPRVEEKLKKSCYNLANKIHRDLFVSGERELYENTPAQKIPILTALEKELKNACFSLACRINDDFNEPEEYEPNHVDKVKLNSQLQEKLKESCFNLTPKVLGDLSETEKRQYERRTSSNNRDQLLGVLQDENLASGYQDALPHLLNSFPSAMSTPQGSEAGEMIPRTSPKSRKSSGRCNVELPHLDIFEAAGNELDTAVAGSSWATGVLGGLDARMGSINLLR